MTAESWHSLTKSLGVVKFLRKRLLLLGVQSPPAFAMRFLCIEGWMVYF